jgi:PhzF family phenazine biosynthesis protein
VRVFQVDTFTRVPFAGNPAAVCLLERAHDGSWMQSIATELAMPATSFVAADGGGWSLRWFTRTAELEICGHGTLAAAHVLWETGAAEADGAIVFATGSGAIGARREADSIFLSLAAGSVVEAEAPRELLDALGVARAGAWRTPLDYLLELESPEAVASVSPNIALLERVETRGVIVTAAGGSDGVDFTSRFFAPRVGIDEDSVTGSAHASLAPFWSQRLGKDTLRARQISSRGGLLDLRVIGDAVEVGGPAVTIARGELLV